MNIKPLFGNSYDSVFFLSDDSIFLCIFKSADYRTVFDYTYKVARCKNIHTVISSIKRLDV